MGAVCTILLRQSQFVGQPPFRPLCTLNGKPLVQRFSPENCQPPIMESSNAPASRATAFPFPKGSSYTQLAVMTCRVSKSEGPRFFQGFHASRIWLKVVFPPMREVVDVVPSVLVRSASDCNSMDLP